MAVFLVGVPFLETHTRLELRQPVSPLAGPQLLFEASDERFSYRASSINIQPDSLLHRAIMAEQPANLSMAQEAAQAADRAVQKIDITYQRMAEAGPLVSLLRIDRVSRSDGSSDIIYATTLVDRVSGQAIALEDLFLEDPSINGRVDGLLCEALTSLKRVRIGNRAERFDCRKFKDISVFDGPPIALLPSETPNLIGGMRFYFGKGRAGPPREGQYIVTLPQALFHHMLKPEYRGLFEGNPIQPA